jgi:LacI family transcriptional regulator
MNIKEDLSKFCCQNEKCDDYGKRGIGNLTVRMRYGKDKRIRLLYCRTCKERFSERKGTPFFQARLPDDKIVSIVEHVSEGCGVRKTGRLVKVNKNTVMRYSFLSGNHSKTASEELLFFLRRNS